MSPPARSPFSALLPTFQTSWDSTSLGWLKTCPRLYQYQMLEQWQARSKGIHLYFGGLYASGVERYAHSMASGATHDTAVLTMVRWVLENSGVREADDTFTPWESNDPIKNRYTLIRSLVWNVEDRLGSPFRTVILANSKPAVELSFSFQAFEVAGEPINLSGHLDELVEADGRYWVKDDKAQPTFCNVLTPTGWRQIGDLTIGDKIAGSDGTFYNVTELHPKGIVPTYKVTFHDNSATFCAYDHLWNVAHDGCNDWKTLPLSDFMIAVQRGQRRHVPVSNAIDHPHAQLCVDPYLLGTLLGDGYLGGNSVSLSTANPELVTKVQEAVGRMGDILRKSPSENLVWTITNNRNCATLAGLKSLQLWGCLSASKFIPQEYMFASIEQRQQLLQGLLDTDGSWASNSRRYQTMSHTLACGVADLVRSLGGTAAVTLQPRDMYRVTLRLGEKGIPIRKRYIKTIERVTDCENVCIGVDSPNHLYLTDNYIVTHNTTKGALNSQYFHQYTPHNQMSLYAVAGRVILDAPVAGVLVRAAQIAVGFTRFATQQIPRPAAVLAEWLETTKWWIEQAHRMAVDNYWPPNDKSCADYGGCPFQSVCAVSPSHRAAWLTDGFDKREWNPLEARGTI